MLICVKVAMFYHTSAFKAQPFLLSKYRNYNFNSLMILTRHRFISQQTVERGVIYRVASRRSRGSSRPG